MPLIPATLISELTNLTVPENMPTDIPSMAIDYGTIIDNYAKTVIPVIVPGSSDAAKAAFISSMQGVSTSAANFIPVFTSSLTTYGATLGLGMQPAFTAIPPPAPIVIAALVPSGLAGATGAQQAQLLGTLIDAWFRTGTAVNNSSGVTVPWS